MSLKTIAMWIFLIFVCIFTFQSSIPNEFVFDDHLLIVNNKDTFPETPYIKILHNDIWGKDIQSFDSHRSFRPLLILFFKLLRLQFGLDPPLYRKISIAFHSLATILVHIMSEYTFGNSHVSFGTALLFASHPVHIESVAAVVNIAENISCIFYLVAYLLFLATATYYRNTLNNIAFQSFSIVMWLILIFIGILFKESALSVCGIIIGKLIIEAVQNVSYCRQRQQDRWNIYSLLKASFWNVRCIVWITVSFLAIRLYILLRNVVISRKFPTLDEATSLSLASTYLNDSLLIRRAENPFSFLEGNEMIMSYMVSIYVYYNENIIILQSILIHEQTHSSCPIFINNYSIFFLLFSCSICTFDIFM